MSVHLYLLVCAKIKMFSFSRVRLNQFWLLFFVCTCINFCMYLCAPTSKNGSFFSCAPTSKLFLLLVCAFIQMFSISWVRLNRDVYIFSCASTSILFRFSRAHLHHVCLPTSKWFLFLLCTSIRIVASTRVRLHKKMVPYSRVRFHQNAYIFSCAPIFSCSLFFVCIYINFTCTCVRLRQKMVPISRARLHQKYLLFLLCAYVKMVPFSRVRLHQNVCFYSGAPALKCFSSAPPSIFACSCVCASQNGFFHSTAPTSKYLHILVCMCWRLVFSCTYLLLRQNSCVELCKPTSKCLLLLGCVSIKLLLFVVCANINFFSVVVFAYVKTFAYTCVRLHLTACSYSCPLLASFYVIVRMYCCVRCLIL